MRELFLKFSNAVIKKFAQSSIFLKNEKFYSIDLWVILGIKWLKLM